MSASTFKVELNRPFIVCRRFSHCASLCVYVWTAWIRSERDKNETRITIKDSFLSCKSTFTVRVLTIRFRLWTNSKFICMSADVAMAIVMRTVYQAPRSSVVTNHLIDTSMCKHHRQRWRAMSDEKLMSSDVLNGMFPSCNELFLSL